VAEYFIHGTRLVVDSDWPRFLKYVALNLDPFLPRRATTDELRVSVAITRRPWFGPSQRSMILRDPAEEVWGDDLISDGRNIRFRHHGLDVDFIAGPPTQVRARYLLDRTNRLASLLREVPSWETTQMAARLSLYLPLFYLKERSGMVVLHAGAVAGRGGAVLLAGLNGVGKTTLCSSLLERLSYMSDNYTLWTGEEVLGFPEALRVPLSREPPSSSRLPSVWGKRLVPVDLSRVVLSAKPSALVFLTRGVRTALSSLTPSESVHRLEILQDMTAEIPRYGYLGPLSPPRRPSLILSLAESVPAYALAVADLATAGTAILDLAGESGA